MDRDPDKWFIGWEWHAGMWYVDPPVGVELDDEAWFLDRDEAFEFVDQQLRKQLVRNSVADEVVPEQPFNLTRLTHESNPLLPPPGGIPRYVPKALRPQESPRQIVTENEKSAARVEDYASRVGLK